jgi:hypothetical protein
MKLTPAQKLALTKIANKPRSGFRALGIRWDVYLRLMKADLVTTYGPLEITDAGKQALEASA